MTPEQNCCFGLRNGKGNKKPLSYEKFGNIVLEERNFEIIRSCALYFSENNRQIILFYQRKVVILQKIYKDK